MVWSNRKRYLKIHLLFLYISIVLSAVIYLLLLNNSSPYSLSLVKKEQLTHENSISYRDLNYDGKSEKILIGKASDKQLYFVTIHNANGTVREQFNLFNYTSKKLISSYDLDRDDHEEIYVFSKSDSVLYLSIIDSKSAEFIKSKIPIFSKPKEVKTEFWDLDEVLVEFADLDNDNSVEMILSPLTGHSVYPRGLYVYDTATFELRYSFPTATPINQLVFYDIDRDGEKEILAHGGTSGNTSIKEDYHDRTNWLFTLNSNLELIKEPFTIGEFPSNFFFDIIRKNNLEYILLAFHNFKNKNPEDSFILIDLYQRILTQVSLGGKSIESYYNNDGIITDDFYLSFKSGEIGKYNTELEETDVMKLDNGPYRITGLADLCEEKGNELILLSIDRIVVLSSELKYLFSINFDSILDDISLCYSDDSYPLISVGAVSGNYLYKIEKNYLLQIIVPLSIVFVFFNYALLYSAHRLISRVFRIIGAYNYTYNDVGIGIIITDYLGKIKSYNKSIYRSLPRNTTITKNKSIFNVFQKSTEFLDIVSNSYRNEKEVYKKVAFSKDDFKFIGTIQVLPLFTLFKIPHAFVIKIQNLTEQIEQDRSAVWSKISQKIAHDIKTPLSTIQLNLNALKSRINDSDFDRNALLDDDIEMIQNEVRRITELTRGFLKFSNLEKPKFQWVRIDELIDKSIQAFKQYFNNGIRFETEINEQLETLWVDPNQFIQLFHIFIENSLDDIDSNGAIKISIEPVDDLQHDDIKYVEILISDNGKGIKESDLSKIFEPFFTQKKDGTGMGLTIAKKIIEDHQGKIDVNSTLNLGTTVTITIPHKTV